MIEIAVVLTFPDYYQREQVTANNLPTKPFY